MIRYKNEQGVVLVLTLFIVTLILLFVLSQFYQVTNTRQQVSTMEKNIVAQHMADMGIDYFRQIINLYDQEQPILDYIDSLPESDTVEIDEDHQFTVELIEIDKTDPDEVIIIFLSTGTAFSKKVSNNSKITITLTEN